MQTFVYILGTRHNGRTLTYVGWTLDPMRRLQQHNAGKGARSTRGRSWIMLYTETHATREDAMRREWRLKRDREFRKRMAQTLPPAAPA